MGAVVDAVHENVVPVTVAVRLTGALVAPEHIVWSSGEFVTDGLGFTVTLCVTVLPAHPLNDEVTLYVTV